MAPSSPTLTFDELDDLIYFSRTGDLSALRDSITTLSQTHPCPPSEIIRTAIDVDEEGLGSGSCLLHYPAANGNIQIVQYLLEETIPAVKTSTHQDVASETQGAASNPKQTHAEKEFINHRNVSGNTALHWAGMNGHLEVVKALLAAGADPEVLNSAGRDAVVESEWSSKDGAADCAVWMLKECGVLEKSIGDEAQEGDGQAADHNDEDLDTGRHSTQDIVQENAQDENQIETVTSEANNMHL